MELMKIITSRSFILNHMVKDVVYIWNDIHTLLGTHSSCSIPENDFIKGVKNAKIFDSKMNTRSLLVHIEIPIIFRTGFLLIRFNKEIDFFDDKVIQYLYVFVTTQLTKTRNYGLKEFLKLYNSISIENILDTAINPYQAFHFMKQYLVFDKEDSEQVENTFDVFGTEGR